ncbi:MAG: hypothetical protein EBS84_21355 [Proteobacteria bacterium]|nr:hypothetical protein [Pseudomonadota bacterium]
MTHRDQLTLDRAPAIEAALRRIMTEPFGCPMCHSGKIITPGKEHWGNCGFGMAARALEPLTAEAELADAVTLAVLQEVERRVEGRSMLHSHIGPLHEIGWNGAIANVCSLLSELMRQAGEVEK